MEYTPYGEQWIDEGTDRHIIGYRFTSKELDSETGLYYFGARYLDPTTSRWMSADPEMSKYLPETPVNKQARQENENLPGIGGVFNPFNLAVYHYANNNPVKYSDPNGQDVYNPGKDEPAPHQFPVHTGTITGVYGPQQSVAPGMPSFHTGLDIAAGKGTPVYASKGGIVVIDKSMGPHYGTAIEIYHGNGEYTRYGHLSATSVKPGQIVQAGQQIGAVGSTGLSTGPHLHYEIREGGGGISGNFETTNAGHPVDPRTELQPRPEAVGVSSKWVEISPQTGRNQNVIPPGE
jgi:RHS repeat-associated protein